VLVRVRPGAGGLHIARHSNALCFKLARLAAAFRFARFLVRALVRQVTPHPPTVGGRAVEGPRPRRSTEGAALCDRTSERRARLQARRSAAMLLAASGSSVPQHAQSRRRQQPTRTCVDGGGSFSCPICISHLITNALDTSIGMALGKNGHGSGGERNASQAQVDRHYWRRDRRTLSRAVSAESRFRRPRLRAGYGSSKLGLIFLTNSKSASSAVVHRRSRGAKRADDWKEL
jgi:hypothetical protein